MAIPQILPYDYFHQWREKTNEIADSIGDLVDLDTTDKTDIVSAINEVVGAVGAIPAPLDDSSISCEFIVGAESVDVINVAVQFKDADDVNIAFRVNVRAYLSDNADGSTLIATAHSSGMVIGTAGLLIPVIADKVVYITTNATGAFDIDITETGTKTAYLVLVLPDGKLAISTAITHAA